MVTQISYASEEYALAAVYSMGIHLIDISDPQNIVATKIVSNASLVYNGVQAVPGTGVLLFACSDSQQLTL